MTDFKANFKRVGDAFAAGGQPTPEEIQQLADRGFKSIVNLRLPDETGVLTDEQQLVKDAGLQYVNVPLRSQEACDLTGLLFEVEKLPAPVYFHCGAGGRASVSALIALATQQKLSREAVLIQAQKLGINPEQPQLKHFLDGLQ